MRSGVRRVEPVKLSRLNWGLILPMVANAVLVIGIVMLIKGIITFALLRLAGAE